MDTIFEYDEEDEYTLPAFFEHFKDKLPMLVIVTGGDYGLTKWDDLCNDTILRYHQHYGLKRVIAKPSNEIMKSRMEFLSIPVLAPYRYQVVTRKQTDVKEQTMEEILSTNQLPVLVQFSKMKIPDVFKEHASTAILLTKVYEEHYLQGNTFIDDELQKLPMTNVLSPKISVAPIIGLKDNTAEDFEKYKEQLDAYVKNHVKFSPIDCNLEVKKFRYGDEGFEGIIDINEIMPSIDKNETEAPKLPPRRGASKDDSKQSDVYYETPLTQSDGEEENDNYEVVEDHFIAKKLPPRPKARMPSDNRPDLPPRRQSEEKQQTQTGIMPNTENQNKKAEYENDIVCPVSPFEQGKIETKEERTQQEDAKGKLDPVKDLHVPNVNKQRVDKERNVSEKASSEYLSIKEVGEVLKKLHLDKYVEAFAKESVDSILLQEFDDDILKDEFQFSKLERMRLLKYIQTGHIPR